MSAYRDLIDWIQDHQTVALDVIRVYLGIGLFARGVLFISAPDGIGALVDLGNVSAASAGIAAYVIVAHLVGGLLLAAGLLTRIAAALQIPILMGAVTLVHWQDGLLSANQSLEFSVLVLFLLVVMFVFGSGRWSADWYVFEHEPKVQEAFEPKLWWRENEADRVPVGDGADGSAAPNVDEGGVAVATASATETKTSTTRCECGNDITHPRVTVEPRYGWNAGFYFMMGISAPVKEVMFYCEECGTVMRRSRDPELLERYRWHTS